jgi:hypothetical protein
MVDGKVVSALTNKNTSRCNVCDQTGPEMAKNVGPFTPVSDQRLSFGASPLHFGLRALEALLHIAYKQDVKCFRIKKPDKDTVQNRTIAVKMAFQRELGLTVDQRREGGFGTTNTGNVVRKAFENAEKTAKICGVSTMLVSNLDVIRRTLASEFAINPEKFGNFCRETLELYLNDAGWYDIPPTLHRILVHGEEIIRMMPVPIGWTSEEGSEANTKFARRFFQNHSRKTSHKDAMSDLFHRLMDISDPLIVGLSQEKKKEKRDLPADMKELLEVLPNQSSSDEDEQNSSANSFCQPMETDYSQDAEDEEGSIIGKISLTDLPY